MIAATDTGNVRSENEDSVCILPALDVAVLADGLGGHKAGEIASRMAVNTFSRYFEERAMVADTAGTAGSRDLMLGAVNAANAEVYSNSRQFLRMEGMGTTVVAVHVRNGRVIIGHVGDSRCYRFSKGALEQLTEDHTLASRLLRGNPAGNVPAFSHHMLDRALGTQPLCEPDILDREALPDDVLLLCSDGLSGVVADTEIAGILTHGSDDPESCADSLIDACLQRGAPDNVSVVLVRVY